MKNNICYIASAGAGKTTWIVDLLYKRVVELSSSHKRIAVVTYTTKNQEILNQRIFNKFGYMPSNILVLGWFEFLLKYLINPYKGDVIPLLYDKHVGIDFVNSQSGVRKSSNGNYYRTYDKSELSKKFLTSNKDKIYSDKLSEYAIACYEKNKPNMLERIDNIFDSILFDEAQDFAGYDFEVIKNILKNCNLRCVIAGDPRQHTFATHSSSKYKGYEGRIDAFLSDKVNMRRSKYITIDSSTLIYSHRCVKTICDFSSKITPAYPPTKECKCEKCVERRLKYEGLQGCFLIKMKDVNDYVNSNNPVALTWDKKTVISSNIKNRFNFGESKGSEYDNVIVYCPKSILSWLSDVNFEIPDMSRAKFYVAVTRARYACSIVVPNNFDNKLVGLPFWSI